MLAVTYVDTGVSDAVQARKLISQFNKLERQAALRLQPGAGVEALEEVARPGHWVLLEAAPDVEQLAPLDQAGAAMLRRLQAIAIAPPDRHVHHAIVGNGSEVMPARRDRIAGSAVYTVVHVDIASADQSLVAPAIMRLLDKARSSIGNVRADAWQRSDRGNHYTLVFAWANRADLDAFEAGGANREFRRSIAALLGAPYDERLYQRRN
jgi:quinol monooxygenase YgiN